MSLEIRTDQIVAVFALGQWHSVRKGSFGIDAYELVDFSYGVGNDDHQDWYFLGEPYPKFPPAENPRIPGSIGEYWTNSNPQGYHGCQWVDEATGHIVSMSLLEIKAWHQNKDEESI